MCKELDACFLGVAADIAAAAVAVVASVAVAAQKCIVEGSTPSQEVEVRKRGAASNMSWSPFRRRRITAGSTTACAACVSCLLTLKFALLRLSSRLYLSPSRKRPPMRRTLLDMAIATLSSWLKKTDEQVTHIIVGGVTLEVVHLQEGAFSEDHRKRLARRVQQGRKELLAIVQSALERNQVAVDTAGSRNSGSRLSGLFSSSPEYDENPATAPLVTPREHKPNSPRAKLVVTARPLNPPPQVFLVSYRKNNKSSHQLQRDFRIRTGVQRGGATPPHKHTSLNGCQARRSLGTGTEAGGISLGGAYSSVSTWLRQSHDPFRVFVHQALQIRVHVVDSLRARFSLWHRAKLHALSRFLWRVMQRSSSFRGKDARKQARRDLADALWDQRKALDAAVYAASERHCASRRGPPAALDATQPPAATRAAATAAAAAKAAGSTAATRAAAAVTVIAGVVLLPQASLFGRPETRRLPSSLPLNLCEGHTTTSLSQPPAHGHVAAGDRGMQGQQESESEEGGAPESSAPQTQCPPPASCPNKVRTPQRSSCSSSSAAAAAAGNERGLGRGKQASDLPKTQTSGPLKHLTIKLTLSSFARAHERGMRPSHVGGPGEPARSCAQGLMHASSEVGSHGVKTPQVWLLRLPCSASPPGAAQPPTVPGHLAGWWAEGGRRCCLQQQQQQHQHERLLPLCSNTDKRAKR
ncbi:hypothetical protein Emed_002505 [Eimeria media]